MSCRVALSQVHPRSGEGLAFLSLQGRADRKPAPITVPAQGPPWVPPPGACVRGTASSSVPPQGEAATPDSAWAP